MKVNIVLLAKNRHWLTHQCLRTLLRNTPTDLYNLTIVDDESSVKPGVDFRKMEHAYLRIEKSKGITGQARNLGIYWAEKYWGRGDYLYLTDNDMYFTPGWLDKMLTLFHGLLLLKYRILGGWNHPFLKPTFVNEWQNYAFHDAVTGASQLMKWETWDQYGPVDAHAPGVGQSEDWAFCQKVVKDGGLVGSIYPRVVFNCGITNSLGQRSPGADQMIMELKEHKLIYPDLWYE